MFWYIVDLLIGFAIGYLVAISKPQKTGYRRGKRDCRNCKYMIQNSSCETMCEIYGYFPGKIKHCASYEKIEDWEGKT